VGNRGQLRVLGLAEGAEPVQGLGLGSAAAAHHDAAGPVDHAAGVQRRLQPGGEALGRAMICAFPTATAAGTA